MFDPLCAAAFQQIGKTHKIGLHIGLRIFQAVAYPGLRGQVDHMTHRLHGKGLGQLPGIAQITLQKGEPVRVRFLTQGLQPGLLEAYLVIAVEIVKTDNRMPLPQQAAGEMKTDKSGSAGHKNIHGGMRACAKRVQDRLVRIKEISRFLAGVDIWAMLSISGSRTKR